MKELEILRSQRFVVWIAFFTVIVLSPNTYYVFHELSKFISPWKELFSALVALVIASAIMIYTVRKNENVALTFAWFEVMIAVYYYITYLGWSWALIPAFGFAGILPYSVKKYTGEIDREIVDEKRNLQIFMDKNPGKKPEDFFNNKK